MTASSYYLRASDSSSSSSSPTHIKLCRSEWPARSSSARVVESSFDQGKLRCLLFDISINGITTPISTVSILPPEPSQSASLLRCVKPPAFSSQDILSSEPQCSWRWKPERQFRHCRSFLQFLLLLSRSAGVVMQQRRVPACSAYSDLLVPRATDHLP